MMEPQVVVPSLEGGMDRSPAIGTDEAIMTPQQPLHEVPVEGKKLKDQSSGPLKQLVNPDSLYKYLSWEDPARTLSSYAGVMTVLFGAHYLPLTQTALKVGATALGVVATLEYANRSFTPNTLMTRLRPRQYKKVPEPILNDTLKDIHDFVQYAVVLVQRIAFGEQLEKTFAAFIGLTVLYWLVKMVSPFTLAVLSVNMLYLAPLVRTRRGREVVQETKLRAGELSNKAIENAQIIANDSKSKVTELSSQAQESVRGTQRRMGELAQSGSQAAVDVSAQIKDKMSDLSESVVENANMVPQLGKNAARQVSDASEPVMNSARDTFSQASSNVASALENTKQKNYSAASDMTGNKPQTDRAKLAFNDSPTTASSAKDDILRDIADPVRLPAIDTSAPANASTDSMGQAKMAVDSIDSHYELKNTSEGLKDVAKSTPRQFTDASNPFTNMAPSNPAQEDHATMDRPRAIPLADIDGAPVFGKYHEPGM